MLTKPSRGLLRDYEPSAGTFWSTSNRFLVQGLMKYTGPGHDATIEITTTSDVQAKLSVVTAETTREPEADNPESEYMVATTVRTGTVELVNNKEEAVKWVAGTVRGKVRELSTRLIYAIRRHGSFKEFTSQTTHQLLTREAFSKHCEILSNLTPLSPNS